MDGVMSRARCAHRFQLQSSLLDSCVCARLNKDFNISKILHTHTHRIRAIWTMNAQKRRRGDLEFVLLMSRLNFAQWLSLLPLLLYNLPWYMCIRLFIFIFTYFSTRAVVVVETDWTAACTTPLPHQPPPPPPTTTESRHTTTRQWIINKSVSERKRMQNTRHTHTQRVIRNLTYVRNEFALSALALACRFAVRSCGVVADWALCGCGLKRARPCVCSRLNPIWAVQIHSRVLTHTHTHPHAREVCPPRVNVCENTGGLLHLSIKILLWIWRKNIFVLFFRHMSEKRF